MVYALINTNIKSLYVIYIESTDTEVIVTYGYFRKSKKVLKFKPTADLSIDDIINKRIKLYKSRGYKLIN